MSVTKIRVFMTATLRRRRRGNQIFTVCNPQIGSRSAPEAEVRPLTLAGPHLEVS